MKRISAKLVISPDTFAIIFMDDTARANPVAGAPDCPVVIAAGYTQERIRKCDCSNELRVYAIASAHGHPCGQDGKCPVRTYLAAL